MRSLTFRGVSVRFGHGSHAMTAVDGVDLEVPPGTVVGLVGESGSGKSTLARAAVGLVPPSSGTITLGDTEPGNPRRFAPRLARPRHIVASPQARRRRQPVQMVFQDPFSSLDPRMTIGESIAEALPRRRDRHAEVRRLLQLVDLDPGRSGDLPTGLSGGQRQRVALARAMAAEPEVVIADEITSALDVSVQGAMLNLIRDLQRAHGIGVLFISHNLAVVRYISDVIAVMYLGRIVEIGPAADLLSAPRHPYTRSLLAAVPRIGSTLDDESAADGGGWRADILDAGPPDPHQPPAGCRFHPRCPIGPLAFPERSDCIEVDPAADAPARPHRAACHYVTDAPADRSVGRT